MTIYYNDTADFGDYTDSDAVVDSVEYHETADFGDYINSADSDEYSDMEMDVEKYLKYYLPHLGSWYPVQIGEVLEHRYQVLHKLGRGGFSTVWMARDLHNQKDVALKIVMSGIDGYSSGEYEFSMHNLIKERVMDTSSLVLYLSTFHVEGNYGATHRVFVLPLCGPSFQATCKLNGGLKEIRNHMPAARQLLLALKSLHDAGIVHRDLNMGAVMWGMIPLDQYDLATKYRYFGRPRKISLVDYHGQPAEYLGKPGDLVKPMVVPRNLLTNNVYLGDFGMAIEAGTSVNFKPQQPFQFCAPERVHNVDPSPASDMWSYMAIVVALYTGFPPFHGVLYEQVMHGWCHVLGPMPAHWKGHYLRVSDPEAINSDRWYGPAGAGHPKHSLAYKVEKRRPDLSTEELSLALRVFLKVFQYEPQDRLTAGQLLEDDDFNALLAIYGC